MDKALSKEIMIKNRLQSQILELGVRGKIRINLNEVIIVLHYLENLSMIILTNLNKKDDNQTFWKSNKLIFNGRSNIK